MGGSGVVLDTGKQKKLSGPMMQCGGGELLLSQTQPHEFWSYAGDCLVLLFLFVCLSVARSSCNV